MSRTVLYFGHPLVGLPGHEDICTQRSSRDGATAAYLFRCKSKTI
jgi:hypothetical protein